MPDGVSALATDNAGRIPRAMVGNSARGQHDGIEKFGRPLIESRMIMELKQIRTPKPA
jgi:hypothetical protein